MEITIDKVVLELPAEKAIKGFTFRASYLCEPKGEALFEIFRDGQPYRRFLWPAYKVYNIAAHFPDIVESEVHGDFPGYDLAGWTGFSVIEPTLIGPETGGNETE